MKSIWQTAGATCNAKAACEEFGITVEDLKEVNVPCQWRSFHGNRRGHPRSRMEAADIGQPLLSALLSAAARRRCPRLELARLPPAPPCPAPLRLASRWAAVMLCGSRHSQRHSCLPECLPALLPFPIVLGWDVCCQSMPALPLLPSALPAAPAAPCSSAVVIRADTPPPPAGPAALAAMLW